MRFACDPLADRVIAEYFPKKRKALQDILNDFNKNKDGLSSNAAESLVELKQEVYQIIERYDKEQLAIGRRFFDRYAKDSLMLLGFLSLPYCYAAANGASVLSKSKKIMEDPKTRLSETAQFVFDVMRPNAFEANGNGLTSIIKVRLMHSAIRWYIKNSGEWDVDTLGEPVNQEDMAGTNLAFCLLVVRGLRKLGKQVDSKDAFAYIYYWNAIGEMLGIDESLLPKDNKEAFKLERDIRKRQFTESEAGRNLTKSLINYFNKETDGTMAEGVIEPFMSFLLGDRVAETIGIKLNFTQKTIFKPYGVFLQLQNLLVNQKSAFGDAYLEYKKHAPKEGDAAFQLP